MDLAFIPPPWRDLLTAIAGCIAAASVLGAALKPMLGAPTTSDPRWKRVVFAMLRVLDGLAVNTATVKSKLELAKKDDQLRRALSLPPAGPAGAAAPVLPTAAILDDPYAGTRFIALEDRPTPVPERPRSP